MLQFRGSGYLVPNGPSIRRTDWPGFVAEGKSLLPFSWPLYIRFLSLSLNSTGMGKGDKKSRRGKIANKSYGARRPSKIKKKERVEEKISPKNKA